MKNLLMDQRLSSQANDLVADLNYARSEAVRRATTVTVCKTLNPAPSSGNPSCDTTAADAWTTGRVIFVDSGSGTSSNDGNGTLNSGELVLRVRQALDGVSNKLNGDGTATGTANFILYNASGLTNLTPKSGDFENQMVVCDSRGPTKARAIVINPTGRVRVVAQGLDLNNAALTSTACP